MPWSTVESPYGNLQVEHPEGATDEEIMNYAKQNFKPDHPKSFQDKLMETWPARLGQGIWEGLKAPGEAYRGELGPAGSRETTARMIQPAAEIAGMAAGNTPFGKTIPSKDQIFEAGSKAFNAARDLGAGFHPDLIPTFARTAKAHLDEAGFGPEIAPKVNSILDKKSISEVSQEPTTVNDILGFRKKLRVAQGIMDPQEKVAATISKNAYDTVLDNSAQFSTDPKAPQAAALLKEGRQNWAAAERLETVDKKQASAERRASSANSGLNTANRIRQKVADILENPKLAAGWSPEAIAQADRVVGGTHTGNTARYIGNLAGKGGGLGGLAATGTAALVGGAPLAATVAGLGIGSHAVDLASTSRQIALLRALLSKESPLSKNMPLPPGSSGFPSTPKSDFINKLASMLLASQRPSAMSNAVNNGSQTQ